MNTTLVKVGEVVQAATAELLVQSYHVNEAPPLGALVQAAQGEGVTVYGVVASIQTAPADPSRKPLARGEAADSLAGHLQREPPAYRALCYPLYGEGAGVRPERRGTPRVPAAAARDPPTGLRLP